MSRWVLAVLVLAVAFAAPAADQTDGWAYKMLAVDGKAVNGHDFGTVPLGTQLHYSFPISNPYGVPLTIFLKTSCGCVKATASKQVLDPTKSGTIEVDMDGRSFSGAKSVNLFVTVHNQNYESTAILAITATLRMDVKLEPGSVAFGLVPRGQAAQRAINVIYTGRLADWQISSVPKSDLFDITLHQPKRAPGRISYQVDLTLKGDATPGTYKQELSLTTNDPDSPTLPVPFEITVQPPLLVSPNPVKVTTRVNGEAQAILTVQSAGARFKITSVEGLGEGVELARPLPTEPRPSHFVFLKVSGTKPGPISRKLTVKTDGDKNLTATISVEGNVVQ